MDTSAWIENGGMFLMCLLVYGTTGLFFCFFLPSGAVMFTAGVLVASGGVPYSVSVAVALFALSALCGNITGYALGRWIGPSLYQKKDTWYFRQKHLLAAETFYQKHGGRAIIAGFFLPVIRSFSPVVAGLVLMPFRKFGLFSLLGALAWSVSFVVSGYFIGSRPFLRPYLTYLVSGFILIVTVPLVIRIVRELRKDRKEG